MDQAQKEYFRKRLQEEMAGISTKMEMLESHSAGTPAEGADIADIASDVCDAEKSRQIHGQQQRYYYKLEEALLRLNEDNYGVCLLCGEDINKERLDAIPVATMCVACKELKNRGA